MPKGKRWHAVQNGPDWMDIRNTIQAIESLHECSCTLTIALGDGQLSSQLLLVALAVSRKGTLPQQYQRVALAVQGSASAFDSLPAKAYALLLELDYKCSGQFWEQGPLPGC